MNYLWLAKGSIILWIFWCIEAFCTNYTGILLSNNLDNIFWKSEKSDLGLNVCKKYAQNSSTSECNEVIRVSSCGREGGRWWWEDQSRAPVISVAGVPSPTTWRQLNTTWTRNGEFKLICDLINSIANVAADWVNVRSEGLQMSCERGRRDEEPWPSTCGTCLSWPWSLSGSPRVSVPPRVSAQTLGTWRSRVSTLVFR